MSDRLFERNSAVTLGSRKSGEALKITGLRTVFQIEKNSESFPNTAKITLYNLSKNSRAMVSKEDAFVMLEAGYGDRLETLYVGDVARAYVSRQGADWVTTIECGDGRNAIRRVHVDRSYAAGTDMKAIMQDVAKSFVEQGKVALGSMIGIESKKTERGDVLSEMSKDAMDRLTKNQGLEWSIQNNTLQVLPKNQALPAEAVLLTPATGLVGVPVLRDVNEGTAGIEFTALILPGIAPGRLVKIQCDQNQSVNGLYKLEAVDFVGDTHGQSWYAEGVAVTL
ncbi:hypothetical protein DSCW_18100 [Desulfosarcina widdelii]|uniref:Uncharacterized protein n=1 Tax=Desulfosarcina widdelii TaxID=947919 RepID=A0A5K7Z2U4_9BACT|nr:hypothetical protein [Desulfosarcina widdelii]BBO74393.1 hypothetical protein DSCW_18100 [Desulfosarcina widdelii]